MEKTPEKIERIALKIISFFEFSPDDKEMIIDFLSEENIEWSGLCDALGVERRGHREKMLNIYDEEMESL